VGSDSWEDREAAAAVALTPGGKVILVYTVTLALEELRVTEMEGMVMMVPAGATFCRAAMVVALKVATTEA
jgi:hypothetical protein